MHRALASLALVVALGAGAANAADPTYMGTWAGTATDIQPTGVTTYEVVMTLGRIDGTIEYPSLNCGGRLTGIGQSTPYAFFIETINHGALDEAVNTNGCINGAITVRMMGDKLGWGWVGIYGGQSITATAVLSRKTR